MNNISSILLFVGTFFSVLASSAQAQVPRAIVSGGGSASDSNPCTYAAPCHSLAAAVAVLPDSGGVLDVLSPGSYEQVTITKPITLIGHGWATISGAPGGAAITVTASPVIISGVQLDGGGTGGSGIAFTGTGQLTVLDSVATHFVSDGISVAPPASAASYLTLRNVVLTNNAANGIGVYAFQVPTVTVSGENVTASGNNTGVHVQGDGIVYTTFDHLVANENQNYGFHVEGNGSGNHYLRNSTMIFNSVWDFLQDSTANIYVFILNHSDIGTIGDHATGNSILWSDGSNNLSQVPNNMQTTSTH
jgi:hypothetical protein